MLRDRRTTLCSEHPRTAMLIPMLTINWPIVIRLMNTCNAQCLLAITCLGPHALSHSRLP